MFLFAHHMAVEFFGREFAPQTPLEHVCAFGGVSPRASVTSLARPNGAP